MVIHTYLPQEIDHNEVTTSLPSDRFINNNCCRSSAADHDLLQNWLGTNMRLSLLCQHDDLLQAALHVSIMVL